MIPTSTFRAPQPADGRTARLGQSMPASWHICHRSNRRFASGGPVGVLYLRGSWKRIVNDAPLAARTGSRRRIAFGLHNLTTDRHAVIAVPERDTRRPHGEPRQN